MLNLSILLSSLGREVNIFLVVSVFIFVIGLFLRRLRQPYIIAYILCGIILGPYGFKVVNNVEVAQNIGDVGIVILMFFIGMEISLPEFVSRWRIAFFGTGMQILFSLGVVALLGNYFNWSTNRIILLGFIIAISSSAVVIKLIENSRRPKNKLDSSVISILLTQDVVIVPMLICITLLNGKGVDTYELIMQIIGGAAIVTSMIYLFRKKQITLPFHNIIIKDHELQVFAAVIVCFGCALLASFFELSASLGALVAGVFMNASDSNKWLHDSLNSFRVILVSIFFVSVGMLINLDFMAKNLPSIIGLVLIVFTVNQMVNALSLRLLGNSWRHSMFGGALLAQIGEFSFILASVGFAEGIISDFTYQMSVIVIALTIFISPFWVGLIAKWVKFKV
ncbi:MAG: cation:proton antiporter [Bacteroidetes bacterium]|nr:cation:proton antiporter [Bacteroidota bacterium]